MKRNIEKYISAFLVICFSIMICIPVFASEGKASDIGTLPDEVTQVAQEVLGILLIIGAAVCIGKCIQIGIKFVSSSANERSDAKAALVPWVIGAIILSAFSLIGNAVIDIIGINGDVLSM